MSGKNWSWNKQSRSSKRGGRVMKPMASLWFLLLLLLTVVSRTTSQTCDRSIPINYNGTIESPGFPDEYYGNQNCVYSFQSSLLGTWQINFTFFNLPNTLCDTDYLEVDYNLYQQRYCQNSTPPDLTNIYQLRFVSSLNESAGYGFQAHVSMVLECGITDIRLKENTPYPLYYDYFEFVHGRCEWTVTADQGLAIMMVGYTNSPNYEYIKPQFKMYKGTTKDQRSLINFKTRNNEFALDEASNTILIEYIANGTFYFLVSVVFKAYNATQSPIYARDGEGDIGLSPNEPQYIRGFYGNGIFTWTIEAGENEVLQLVIRYFSIQTEIPGCNDSARSYLEIYDELQTDSNLLVRACSPDEILPITSTTRRLVVVLTLDDDFGFTTASFTARYKSFNKSAILRDCGGDISGDEGVVSSPNYPANYDNLRVCEWRITVEDSFIIRIEIHDLDISPSNTGYFCAEDTLLFTGAYPRNSQGPYYQVCGVYDNYFGPPIYSANNSLTMRFVSDWQNNGRGFNASWRKVCDQILQTSSGWIQSPRFPAGYLDNLNCSYDMQTLNNQPGYFTTFTFNSFDLQEPDSKGSCIYDYLEIVQVPSFYLEYHIPEAKQFCGKGPTQSLITYFPTTIQFVTDGSIAKGGFNISYVQTMAGCGQSLFVGEEGFLFSPNHPGTFPPNLNCTTTIRVRPGNNITLTFESFYLGNFLPMDNGSDCWRQSRSVLEIHENILIGIYCGYELPRPITSTGNELTLIFRSSSNDYATGYNATYVSTSTMADDCYEPDFFRSCLFGYGVCVSTTTQKIIASVPSLTTPGTAVTIVLLEIKCILGRQEDSRKHTCPPRGLDDQTSNLKA